VDINKHIGDAAQGWSRTEDTNLVYVVQQEPAACFEVGDSCREVGTHVIARGSGGPASLTGSPNCCTLSIILHSARMQQTNKLRGP
jgi:hypothetical protein